MLCEPHTSVEFRVVGVNAYRYCLPSCMESDNQWVAATQIFEEGCEEAGSPCMAQRVQLAGDYLKEYGG